MVTCLQLARVGSFNRGAFYRRPAFMTRILYSLTGAAAIFCAATSMAADEDKPQGRVCISIVDSGPSGKEEPFRASTTARPGSIVQAHVDASDKCTVLVAA
jgi:hypothetical protein